MPPAAYTYAIPWAIWFSWNRPRLDGGELCRAYESAARSR
jgi:hypothetical protein